MGKSDPAAKRLPPSVDEQAAIDRATLQLASREPRFQIEIKQRDDGTIEVFGGSHNDQQGWRARLENLFGSRGDQFAVNSINHLIALCQDSEKKINTVALNAMVSMIEAARPENELQAALAVQMAMMHSLTTQAIRRAAKVDQIPQFDSAGNMAVKLARTFTMQAETLAKLQRGGEQVVKIVHVHPGAQAVIGNVSAPGLRPSGATGAQAGGCEFFGPRGGGSDENRNRPHAKAELPAPSAEPMPEMRGEVSEREPVPVASRRR